MKLTDYGDWKYKDVKNERLRSVLGSLERFNPDLPGMVEIPDREQTWKQYRSSQRRIAHQLRDRGIDA